LSDGEKTYTYDQSNRLTNISANGLAWSATYNGDGARLRQVTNGVPTTYTLDLNAGLVQVLEQQDVSGTTTYLYGVTRVGEQQPNGWAYHLSDALGSVRQLVDAAAQVTLARGYMPYGEELWSLGTGSSEYGYTGEDWNTTIQMVFLRARYMQPGLGIFTQRDTWAGDPNRPMSYNACLYAYANPVNATDPTGFEPVRGQINYGYSYSCHCGWIDWGHSIPTAARRVLRRVYYEPPENRFMSSEYKSIYAYEEAGIGPILLQHGLDFVVRRNMSIEDKKRVALGIYMDLSDDFENWQGTTFGPFGQGTFYSEEDLASDLIAFYAALERVPSDGMSNGAPFNSREELRGWARPICKAPTDDTLDVKWSTEVFDEPYAPFEKVTTWAGPRLKHSCKIDEFCGNLRAWPHEFNFIRPEPPVINGKWWRYRGPFQDGIRFPTDQEGVSYLLWRPQR
jgi:RHS repeat-associated protein